MELAQARPNYKFAQACEIALTSVYTRIMLSTTLFPGYDNPAKPGDKLVSLHKDLTAL